MTFRDLLPWLILTVLVFGPVLAVMCYIICMAAKPYRDTPLWKIIPIWVRGVLHVCLVVGVFFDAVYQYTWAVIHTWEWPWKGEHVLTKRLRRYRKLDDRDPRKKWAVRKWDWINLFDKGHW